MKCKNIMRDKLKIINKMNQILGKDDRILELCEDEQKFLTSLSLYILNLIRVLWEQPKLVAEIIEQIDINELKEHLGSFFALNLYENLFSSDCIEDNLLYVLTLLMQSEIKNLNDINQKDKFLIDTHCGVMFEEIYKKVEVQMYLNMITKNAIENLEKKYSNNKIEFNLNKIVDELNSKSSNQINDDANRRDEFNQKYIPNLDESSLTKMLSENKNSNIMIEYLKSKLSLFAKGEKQKYSNKNFLSFCYGYKNSDKLINLYMNKFFIAIDFIEQIFQDISNNMHSIPVSLKKICKIISELITQKFPNINSVDKNVFISKFFFDKLLIPFLLDNNIFSYLNENTLYNLKLISSILKKFINGELFISENSEFSFTPFNWYIIYNIEKIDKLFQRLTKIELSSYLENLINNKLPPDFEYEYFNENPDKNVVMQSTLYNIEQIRNLVITIDNNKELFFKDNKNKLLKKIIERLMQDKHIIIMENILNKEKEDYKRYQEKKMNKKDKKKQEEFSNDIPKINYFIFNKLIANKKYENILNIQFNNNFLICGEKESIEKIEAIQLKNKLYYLLNNYKILEKSDFDEDALNNINKILNTIYSSLTNFGYDTFIKLSAKYSLEKYYEKYFCELENDINESIKGKNLEILSNIFGESKNQNISEIKTKKYLEIIEDFDNNKKARKIIKEFIFPVDLKFKYENSKDDIFNIKESSFKEKDKDKEDKINKYEKANKVKLCLNIDDFIKNFPDFMKYQESKNNNIFNIQAFLRTPEQINNYIEIIKKKLKAHNIMNYEVISNIIYDYILEKIFDKCCPNQPYEEDKYLLKKCILLKWIQPYHLIIEKQKIFLGQQEDDFSYYFKLFSEEKSLRKKGMILNRILDSIEYINGFYKFKPDDNIDDMLPLITYFIIKAQPTILNSHLRIMQLYFRDKHFKEGTRLSVLQNACDFIIKMNHNDLLHITLEEFESKCKESSK